MVTLRRFGLSALALLAAYGCSAVGDPQQGTGSGGGGTAGGDTGAGASTGGAGGTGNIGVGANNGEGGSGGEASCAAVNKEAQPKLQNADIVFVIDTSGSMGEESGFVNEEMNKFSQQIVDSGIDVRVIMLAESPPGFFPCFGQFCPPGVCIDGPLGSGSCPDDTNPPHYQHISGSEVSSNDGMDVILNEFSSYEQFLRQDATKSVVVITDDNAVAPYMNDAQTFLDQLIAKNPTLMSEVVVHGIYCQNGSSGDCAAAGTNWEALIDLTGGIHGDLSQQDFKPIFDQLATQVIIGAAQLECQWDLPAPPEGETLDPAKVNVIFTDDGGAEHELGYVPDEGSCDDTQGGWYYDNPSNPTTIYLCSASCDVVQGASSGKIDIAFGCATTPLAPPE